MTSIFLRSSSVFNGGKTEEDAGHMQLISGICSRIGLPNPYDVHEVLECAIEVACIIKEKRDYLYGDSCVFEGVNK